MSSFFIAGSRSLPALRLAVTPLGTIIGFGIGLAILLIIVLVILNDTRRQVGQVDEAVDTVRRQNNRLFELQQPKASTSSPAAVPALQTAVPSASAELPQGELIAVISAAIAAFESDAPAAGRSAYTPEATLSQPDWDAATTAGFRIKRIRRVS